MTFLTLCMIVLVALAIPSAIASTRASREHARTMKQVREIAEREERRKMKEQRDRGW